MFVVYDPKRNTVREIEPNTSKADFIEIQVSYIPCRQVYYAVCDSGKSRSVSIKIVAYDLHSEESRVLYSFDETPDVMTGQKRVRIFVLSPTQLLIQTEMVATRPAKSLMGNIIFSQIYYNTETDTTIRIVEENLNNNGIHSIIPLNETEVRRPDFLLEDSRLCMMEKDAFIESV